MKLKYLFLSLFILILFSCSEKKQIECDYINFYYPLSYKAEIEYHLKNYQNAFNFYSQAFAECEPIDINVFSDTKKFAFVCARLGKDELALDFVEKAIYNGGSLEEFNRDSVFTPIFNSKRGKKLLLEFSNIRSEYLKGINFELREELQQMIRVDQKYNMKPQQDSIFKSNERRLVEIFEEFGYPNENIVGHYNIDQIQTDPAIILLHTSDSIRIHYFLPKIKEFVNNGECSPYLLGRLVDNLNLFNDKPQTHGTFLGNSSKYARMISDRNRVDSNRIQIGLPILEKQEIIDSLKGFHY